MTPAPMFDLGRLLRLIPALVVRDPLFRYGAIAAIVALLVLIAQFAQDIAGAPTVPPTPAGAAGADAQHSAATPAKRDQGQAVPAPVAVPTISPGRPLDGISVEPSASDTFGKTPRGARSP
jgi:hypothetical protein